MLLLYQERRNPRTQEEWILNKDYAGRSCRLEQPPSAESRSCNGENKPQASGKMTMFSDQTTGEIYQSLQDPRAGNTRTRSLGEALNFPHSLPRRSFCRVKQLSVAVDDSNLPSSPVFPTYLAITESARAKTRSMSTPRQRIGYFNTCNDQNGLSYDGGVALSCPCNSDFTGADQRWGSYPLQKCESLGSHYWGQMHPSLSHKTVRNFNS